MNKSALTFFFLLFMMTISAQTPSFRIDGKVHPKYNGSLVTLFTFTGDYIRTVDSAYVDNGTFCFEGSEYLYEKSLLSIGNYPDTVLTMEFMLERGLIEVEMKQKPIIRTPVFRAEYRQFLDSCSALFKEIDSLQKQSVPNESAFQKLYSYRYQFKKKHIHNGLGRSLFLEDSGYRDDPYFYKLHDLLTERDKQRYDVRSEHEKRKRQDAQQWLANKPFLNFTLIDSIGEEKQISDYVGKSKLLFLDFWASWCGPCIAQKPQIKGLYQKYKEQGFEVLGISLDIQRTSWLAALKKQDSIWPNLCVANQEQENELRELYHIVGIPYGILIDQSGNVVSVIVVGWQQLKVVLETYYKN